MSAIFVDAGAWIAMVQVRDKHADRAAAWYRANATKPLVTTNYVLDEAVARLRYDAGLAHAIRLRGHVEAAIERGRLRRVWIDEVIEAKAWKILEANPRVPLSFTDATSIAVAKQARIRSVFGFDGDFRDVGFDLVPR